MNASKSICYGFIVVFLMLFSCSNAYKLQKTTPIQYSRAYFQNWTSAIKIGSSGYNFHIANLTPTQNIVIDSVFFRNLKGRLMPSKGKYICQLIKRNSISEGHGLNTLKDFPFDITNRECVISYRDHGETKYFKISNVIENEGIYYEEGPLEMQ
ncbi:hypothetical protein [Psychroserpens damuponensis]|uniref:hypothetical protein n=1 Tax=Psychroserpens damuponensis TaxID=943936 RepID=UPI000B0BA5FC|nr:hypothetical protein [Psychroserpens damuponensis]